jgi:diaminopimelate decarboxylase
MIHRPTTEFLETIETPVYLYDLEVLKNTLEELKNANTNKYKLHYALKANTDSKVLETIRSYGHGVDCVSGGEIEKALESGFAPESITFAGVGKTDKEMTLAIESGIGYFNIESLEEIDVLQGITKSLGKKVDVCVRVNPNIDAHTHAHITTGLEDGKFGVALDSLEDAIQKITESESFVFSGLHFHIGSQIDELVVFENLAKKVQEIVNTIETKGYEIKIINLGGGLAVDYLHPIENTIPDFRGYFHAVEKHLQAKPGQEIHFEFGRAIVAQCGMLVTKVLFNKKAGNKDVVIVDAGMTELMRPALYDAYHHIENATSSLPSKKYTVVGPICESTDTFGEDRDLSETKRGDILVIYSTGAYGQTMSSEYNHRKKAKTYYL